MASAPGQATVQGSPNRHSDKISESEGQCRCGINRRDRRNCKGPKGLCPVRALGVGRSLQLAEFGSRGPVQHTARRARLRPMNDRRALVTHVPDGRRAPRRQCVSTPATVSRIQVVVATVKAWRFLVARHAVMSDPGSPGVGWSLW
jgi:hypothetical protein